MTGPARIRMIAAGLACLPMLTALAISAMGGLTTPGPGHVSATQPVPFETPDLDAGTTPLSAEQRTATAFAASRSATPTATIRIFWFFPIEVRWIVILYVLFDLYPVLLTLSGDKIYVGHVGDSRVYRVRGKVIGPDGAPAKNAMVMAMPKETGGGGMMFVRSVAGPGQVGDGTFEVSSLAPGSYYLNVNVSSICTRYGTGRPLSVAGRNVHCFTTASASASRSGSSAFSTRRSVIVPSA